MLRDQRSQRLAVASRSIRMNSGDGRHDGEEIGERGGETYSGKHGTLASTTGAATSATTGAARTEVPNARSIIAIWLSWNFILLIVWSN